MSAASSQGSAGWTPDSPEPGTSTSSSAKPTRTGEMSSPPDGPECPSSTTWRLYVSNQRRELREMDVSPSLTEPGGFTQSPFLVSSPEGSPAKTSASPASEPDSQATDLVSSSSSPVSSTLFDPDGFSSRTYPVSSLATAVGTSESCLERWPTSGTAWRGGFSTAVSSECRSADGVCSSSEPSLTEILEPPQSVPARYSLSARAAQGILRRAEKRGRTIPEHLWRALSAVAEGSPETTSTGGGHTSLSGLGNGGPDDNDAQAGRLVVARALTSHADRQDATVDTFVAHSLTSAGHDASEDGTGRGTPIVAFPISGDALRAGDAKTPSPDAEGRVRLRDPGLGIGAEGDPASGASPGAVAAPLNSGGHPNSNMPGRRKEDDENLVVAGPLGGGNDGIGHRSEDDPNLVAYPLARRGREHGSELEVGEAEVYNALRAGDGGSSRLNQVMVGLAVRRLTPTECERLQGLPDGWTELDGTPDSRRYSALGDAVTANVAEWLGRRLEAA